MKDSLRTLCNQFIEDRDIIKGTFKWESSYMYPVCANLFCARGVKPDEDKLRECKEIISQQTGIFSSFRGNIRIPLICMLSLEDHPREKFSSAQEIYWDLKEYFRGSDYLALTAFLLTDDDYSQEKLARGRRIYRLMKDEHPFLTSSEDSIFAVLMASSEKTDEALIRDMETCYRRLKEHFSDSNCVQTMSHIMALDSENAEIVSDKVLTLYEAIEKAGRKYGKHHELSILAALATMKIVPDQAARDIMDADAFLAEQKGYGALGMDKKTRLMHAAMIVSDEYVPHDTMEQVSLTGTISMMIAQQMMMCAVMASTTAAAAAASAHH